MMLNSIRSAFFAAMACVGCLALPVAARGDAATQPSKVQPNGAAMRPGPAYVIKRMKDAVATLDLSDEQKTKVDSLFDHVTQEGLALSQELGSTPMQQRYQKLLDFAKQIRGELAGILTDDQMALLNNKALLTPPNFNGKGQVPGTAILGAIQQALDKLDLTDDEKQQIKDVFTEAKQKIADIRARASDGANIQQGLQDVRQFIRQKLQTILSPDQMQELMQSMQQFRQNHPELGQPGAGKAPVTETKPADLNSTGPDIGAPVPDVQIIEAGGRAFTPSKYKGHVLVLEFGSLSCPVFRQHAAEMEKLKAAEGSRAFFIFVYTREAFPAGDKDVQRNRDDGISITDATTLDERKKQVNETARRLNITMTLAVDSMDNAVSTAFGGFPNGAVVIGKDGTIAERQQWTNPGTLKVAIDDAAAQTSGPVASTR